MNVVRIGKYKGRCIYVPDEKLDELAKIFPYTYLRCLEGVCEIIKHHREIEEKSENEIVFDSVFGKVGIKRDDPNAQWVLDWHCFSKLEG